MCIRDSRKRGIGLSEMESARQAGMARFRPILLTSLTTFAGLTPLLLEKSLQAKFLVPMGISLGFGVIFATVITLILVPTAYLILDDLRQGARWLAGLRPPDEPAEHGERTLGSSPSTKGEAVASATYLEDTPGPAAV